MEPRLSCGSFLEKSTNGQWFFYVETNCWHWPGHCIGCDSIRHTRSAAAGLKTRTSYRKLSSEITKIIFAFVDWKEVYEGNLKLLRTPSVSEASKIEMRMPLCVEFHAYVFGDSPYPKPPWPFGHGAPINPLFARWPGPQHPMLAGWMEKMRPI